MAGRGAVVVVGAGEIDRRMSGEMEECGEKGGEKSLKGVTFSRKEVGASETGGGTGDASGARRAEDAEGEGLLVFARLRRKR